jgi:hypothetical protein
MSDSDSIDECIFCFEKLDKYDIAILNCRHKYHVKCIRSWNKISKKYNVVCPQCNISGEILNVIPGKIYEPNKLILPPPPPRPGYRHINTVPSNISFSNGYNLPQTPFNRYSNSRLYNIPLDTRQENRTQINNLNQNRRQRINSDEIIQPYICCNIL